jgi:hypothetical protein
MNASTGPLFLAPDGAMWVQLRERVVAPPLTPPSTSTRYPVQGAGIRGWLDLQLWLPVPHGTGWRTVVGLSPLLGPVAFDGPSSLSSLVDACHLLRWVLGMGAVDVEDGGAPEDLGGMGPGSAPAPGTWPTIARSDDHAGEHAAIQVGAAFVGRDAGTSVCPVSVDGATTHAVSGCALWAIVNACAFVERRTPWMGGAVQ